MGCGKKGPAASCRSSLCPCACREEGAAAGAASAAPRRAIQRIAGAHDPPIASTILHGATGARRDGADRPSISRRACRGVSRRRSASAARWRRAGIDEPLLKARTTGPAATADKVTVAEADAGEPSRRSTVETQPGARRHRSRRAHAAAAAVRQRRAAARRGQPSRRAVVSVPLASPAPVGAVRATHDAEAITLESCCRRSPDRQPATNVHEIARRRADPACRSRRAAQPAPRAGRRRSAECGAADRRRRTPTAGVDVGKEQCFVVRSVATVAGRRDRERAVGTRLRHAARHVPAGGAEGPRRRCPAPASISLIWDAEHRRRSRRATWSCAVRRRVTHCSR